MGYQILAKNLMLGHLRQQIAAISLHSGPPTNSNEIRGTRIEVQFAEPLNGEMKLREKPVIPVPEGATVTHAGFWSSAGRLLASGAVQPALFPREGNYILDSTILDLNNDLGSE